MINKYEDMTKKEILEDYTAFDKSIRELVSKWDKEKEVFNQPGLRQTHAVVSDMIKQIERILS